MSPYLSSRECSVPAHTILAHVVMARVFFFEQKRDRLLLRDLIFLCS